MDMTPDAVALRYLRYLALREGGYTRRGVPGWALREDVERGTGLRLPERLPLLHARGLLDREDVRAPRLRRPVWIYRVGQAGADRAARDADLPLRPVLRPLRAAERQTDAAVHVPAASALALRALRRALETRAESPHLPGEPGWRSLDDLRAQAAAEAQAEPQSELPAVREPWPDDVEWLVRTGLAQKWTAHRPGRRGVPLYRVTALGGVAIPLEWREPR